MLVYVLLESLYTALSNVIFTGYSEVHRALAGSVLLTTGEHEYSRYGYLQLLQQCCADIIQPDITWLGGLTEVILHLSIHFSVHCSVSGKILEK